MHEIGESSPELCTAFCAFAFHSASLSEGGQARSEAQRQVGVACRLQQYVSSHKSPVRARIAAVHYLARGFALQIFDVPSAQKNLKILLKKGLRVYCIHDTMSS